MLDIKYRFTCGDSDLSYTIKKCQNIMTRIVVSKDAGTISVKNILVSSHMVKQR